MNVGTLNLAARFLLEITGLVALALYGLTLGENALRFVYAAVLPILAAATWGIFAVPGDKSRSGKAPVPVPGTVRLAIECLFFSAAVWALSASSYPAAAWVFGILVCFHYAVSYRRILWLLER